LLFDFPNIEILFKVRTALKKETGYDALISIAVPHPTHWGVASVWTKNKIAKLAEGIHLSKLDMKSVKTEINRQLREIDECIRLLNQ
jgi:hypothetical protein